MDSINKKNFNKILKFIIAIIIIAIIVILLYWYLSNSVYNTKQINGFLGNQYEVHRKMPNSRGAANLLEKLNDNNIKLFRYLKNKYDKDNVQTEADGIVYRLVTNYNPDRLIENSPNNITKSTSYTINKGEKIAICLRDKKTLKLHDINTLTYVMLHELAHVATIEKEHPPIFWETFKVLLKEASNIGIYTPINYSSYPQNYCGIQITDNPLFDNTLRNIT